MATDDSIPSGLCGCGCGQKTNIAPHHHRKYSILKGQPYRYLKGHFRRARHRRTYAEQRTENGKDRIHRLRAEKALGHPLPPNAVVHHPDRDPWNPTARLVICDSTAYHSLLHRRMRIKAAGGNPNTDKICGHCHALKPKTDFSPNKALIDGLQNYCPACRLADGGRREPGRRLLARQSAILTLVRLGLTLAGFAH